MPATVQVIEDNIEWTYNLTVPANSTVRLAHFTILDTTRAGAEADANALVTGAGFGGEAASFLTPSELASLANFDFSTTDVDVVGGNLVIAEYGRGHDKRSADLTLVGPNVRINDAANVLKAGLGVTRIDAHTVEVPFSSFSSGSIQVNTLGGDDTLTLDLTGGDFIPDSGVIYAGGGNFDSLNIDGGSQGAVSYFVFERQRWQHLDAELRVRVIHRPGTDYEYWQAPPTILPFTPNVVTLGDDGIAGNSIHRGSPVFRRPLSKPTSPTRPGPSRSTAAILPTR